MKLHHALKHYFIPHVGNDYQPHIFRELSITILLIIVVALFATSAGTSIIIRKTDLGAAVLPAVLADLTNQARAGEGEPILIRNTVLDTAAQMKADDMAAKGYFAHTSPEGITPWYWFSKAGYNFVYAGENLAVDFTESVNVENAWLNSPTHRANILNARFSEIGIATASGTYKGKPTIFVVQTFGAPVSFAPIQIPAPIPVPVAPTPTPAVTPGPVPAKKEVPTTAASAASAPLVEGASSSTESQKLETLAETDQFVAVKNTNFADANQNAVPTAPEGGHYSKWYERLLFNQPNLVDTLYLIFAGIVGVALVLLFVIEVEKRHPKNIMYGFIVLIFLMSLVYLNHMLFVPHVFLN